jgi:ATP-dependent helicase/nuclease subunit A
VSERTPTPEQAAAITAAGPRVLVEAGAGTGKTGVIVDRYCRLVCDEGISPDSVLVFTFTEKAAAELVQRVRAALRSRADAGSERARELLAEIGKAWITTIHGFCNRVLAGHPVAAGIDPHVRILDALEAERVAREAFDEALEAFFATGEESRELTVAAYYPGTLRGIVIHAYNELRSRGVAEPRLPEPPIPDAAGALQGVAAVAAATLEELRPTSPHRDLLERALALLGKSDGRLPDLDELASLRTRSKAKSMQTYRAAIEVAVEMTAEAGEGGETYRHIDELLRLFSTRFEAAKERRAGLDFEDLQILAARLLERSEIGDAYRARFTHVMVDEFQDTNRLQLRLVEALRGPRTELMVVGDELQSIYGFRHADLEVFREQRREIEADPDAEATALSGNFRSRPEIIGAVNAIGEQLLGDAYQRLRVGVVPSASGPPGEGPAVEVLLTARDDWDDGDIDLAPVADSGTPLNQLAEARFLAARLRELVDSGVERGSMVVLLRAFTHVDAYEDSLERAGLRPCVIGGRGYWSQQQVADVCALLATLANPLDDQALFGALASPACGAGPDTLWLLRAAAGKERHIWPTIERVAGQSSVEPAEPDWLSQIPEAEIALLRRFARTIEELRKRALAIPLADLINEAVTATGYDLAVLMLPAGEARFANVRKLMKLAAEFEQREGRDLRGLLDFLASRADSDTDAQAATALEGHDGVRVMTIHSAKGLEFDVVAVPRLSRTLLSGSQTRPVSIGYRDGEPRAGLQLRRLGAPTLNLFGHRALREEVQAREAEEELRLFHVAATRSRERLVLSGIVKPKAGKGSGPSTSVIERIVDAFELDRESPSSISVPPPLPRAGLDAEFDSSEIPVIVNLPSPEQAAALRERRDDRAVRLDVGKGPAPLVRTPKPAVPSRQLSYTALAAYDECAYRFYLERVLELRRDRDEDGETSGSGGEEGTARGRVVHALLEWSHANEWSVPPAELVRALAAGEELDPDADDLAGLVRGWLESDLLRDLSRAPSARIGAEVPILIGIDGNVLTGSIDLLVEREGRAPLVVDYKTDRLDGKSPAERAARAPYVTQRAIYALAVAEARKAPLVEIAYVFLEAPNEPAEYSYDRADLDAERLRLKEKIEAIGSGGFEPALPVERSASLCGDCPALKRMCSGHHGKVDPEASVSSAAP